MSPGDAEKEIRQLVSVTPQKVVLAKAIIAKHSSRTCTATELIELVLKRNQLEIPAQVFLFDTANNPIPAVAEALSWRMVLAPTEN